MKILTYQSEGGLRLGILSDAGLVEAPLPATAFYRRGLEALSELREWAPQEARTLPREAITPAPVVPRPGKIIGVGLNYREHAEESGMDLPEAPILFGKFNNALAADGEEIPVDGEWGQIDYEAELAVIVGRVARRVSESEALDYVLGYCCANDLSERELQFRSGQWLLGKTLDKFLPLGPYLVTADEIEDPQNLRIRGWLNGQLRQDSRTSDMIFTVAQIVAYASRYMTLFPGDVIVTGTPSGVVLGKAQKKYMQAGDEYVVQIEGLGRLSNRLVQAPFA